MTRKILFRSMYIILVIAATYFVLWVIWKNGVLLAQNVYSENSIRREIQVRKVPSAAYWWALPFSVIPDEYPCFRCDLFRNRSNIVFSSHTVQMASFEAVSKVTIEWNKQGEAAIYIDGDLVLKCDANGFWRSTE